MMISMTGINFVQMELNLILIYHLQPFLHREIIVTIMKVSFLIFDAIYNVNNVPDNNNNGIDMKMVDYNDSYVSSNKIDHLTDLE